MKIGLIVEGHHDENRLRAIFGLKFQFVVTNGTRFTNRTRIDIEKLIRFTDRVYILTDPDEAGDILASKISEVYPDLKRIIVDPERCKYLDRRYRQWCGIEYIEPHYAVELFRKEGLV